MKDSNRDTDRTNLFLIGLCGFVAVMFFPSWEDAGGWPPIYDFEFGVPYPWLRWNSENGAGGFSFPDWKVSATNGLIYLALSLSIFGTIELGARRQMLRESRTTCALLLTTGAVLTLVLFSRHVWYSLLLLFFALIDSATIREQIWWAFVYAVVPLAYLSIIVVTARCFADTVVAGVITIVGAAILVVSYALVTKGWV